jgi:HK97 family phage major capsid protein
VEIGDLSNDQLAGFVHAIQDEISHRGTLKAFQEGRDIARGKASAKATAILAGADFAGKASNAFDINGSSYKGEPFLAHIKAARAGDPDSNAYVKGVLGTSSATGTAIIPNNFVAELTAQVAALTPWRRIFNSVNVGNTAAIDIPYEVTGITAALLQGAYGSNKEIRDWSFNRATATLYQIAQIADVGNQLLRQSGGAAEASARRRLGASIAVAESNYVVNGTGSSQPLGILPALLAYGDIAAFKTTLSSEPRVATIGRAIGALESRGQQATAVVLHPTTFWAAATEGLGTSYAGGWALDPAAGAAATYPQQTIFGVPVFRCPDLPTATGLVLNAAQMDLYFQGEMTIDVSSEAGSRFDQNVTGFRCEELFGFNAEPYVRTGMVQKVLGL